MEEIIDLASSEDEAGPALVENRAEAPSKPSNSHTVIVGKTEAEDKSDGEEILPHFLKGTLAATSSPS